jgi:hypothetical protein
MFCDRTNARLEWGKWAHVAFAVSAEAGMVRRARAGAL